MSSKARTRSEELRRIQAENARREARTRRFVAIVGAVVVLGLVAGITGAVWSASQSGDGGGASGKVVVPADVEDGAIPVGSSEAPVAVTIYFDYMCPACGQLEATQGEDLDRLVTDEKIRIDLKPISFLDRTSQGTEYSTRAANAVATVADGSPEHVWPFHQALYAQQPQEGTAGLGDEQIASIAREAGVPASVVDRFADRTYDGWVAQVTDDAFDSGVEQTPTVLVDGEQLTGDLFSPGAVAQAVADANGGQ